MEKNPVEQLLSVRLSVALTLTLLFLLPLAYTPGFGSYTVLRYFFLGTVCLILGLATAWTWIRVAWVPKLFLKNSPAYGVLFYLAAFLFVSFLSTDNVSSFWSSFQRTDGAFTILFSTIFALNIFTLLAIRNKSFLNRLFGASILGAVVLSILIMCFTYNTKGTWFEVSRGGATVGNSSLAAAYVLWNIFFGIYLVFKSNSRYLKIVWGLTTIILLLSPLFINWQYKTSQGLVNLIGAARGATIGIIFGVIIAASLWLIWQPDKRKKYFGIILLTLTLIGTIGGAVQLLIPTTNLHKIFGSVVSQNRYIFWDIAIKAFKVHPAVGWGPGTFSIPYHAFYNPKMLTLPYPEVWVSRTHNIIFETLATGGILLFAALCFFLISIVISIIKAKKHGQLTVLEASLLMGALAGWFLQAQFVFESIVSLSMLFLSTGVVYAFASEKAQIQTNLQKTSSFSKLLFSAFVLGTIILFVYSIALPYKKSRQMISIYKSHLPQRIDLWQHFGDGTPMGNNFDSVLILDSMNDLYEKKAGTLSSGNSAEKKIAEDELTALGAYLYNKVQTKKYSFEFALIGAKIYYLQMKIANDFSGSTLDQSLTLADKAIEQSPTDPQSYWIAAKIQAGAGNFVEARKLLEQAYAIEPTILETNRLILNLSKLSKDKDYYESALTRAKQTIPNFEE